VDDDAIELFARHTRGAGARLEMEREIRGRDEGSVTSAAGTADVGRLVESGVHVAAEVALALEMAIAFPAVMVIATMGVVLLQGPVVWEGSFTGIAIRHGGSK
jgi:hypothetical protein